MKRVFYLLPVLLFIGLALFLFHSLKGPAPGELPSVLIDKPVPRVDLPGLAGVAEGFASRDFVGHVTILNVWASWCAPCRTEMPSLLALAREGDVAVYGLAYKDKSGDARRFLGDAGNPFRRIGFDPQGRAAIEWGVYGVPETYIIDAHGIIRDRYVGAITPDILENQIRPAIARARS